MGSQIMLWSQSGLYHVLVVGRKVLRDWLVYDHYIDSPHEPNSLLGTLRLAQEHGVRYYHVINFVTEPTEEVFYARLKEFEIKFPEYNLLASNCQHFAWFLTTGGPVSPSVDLVAFGFIGLFDEHLKRAKKEKKNKGTD
eukprot:TRINITY_DN3597_c0_g1_i1.p2 TRINITY_DN3597_c0_g1~~TRINITY_DN3597_c0_g1_i1.p2  ORF type:complete len:139 (+),score=27.57 TRINITY_DN3597_c0_g1_i1:503-919(+)